MLQMYDFLTSMASCNATTWLVNCLRLVNTNLHGGTPRCCSSGPWCRRWLFRDVCEWKRAGKYARNGVWYLLYKLNK